MNIKALVVLILSSLLLVLPGCGGGGGSNSPSQSATVISGVASKGIIKNGTIKVYAVNADGSKGTLLKQVNTDATGAYSADVGAYTGPVLVEASGDYTDEATGIKKTITSDAPLRAALDSVVSSVSISVTPLTELAVKKAEDPVTKKLPPTSIKQANTVVSNIFNVDIINIKPVEATTAGLQGATQAAKDYTLALAAVSQLASQGSLSSVLTSMASEISNNTISTTKAEEFKDALTTFVTSNPNNQTGVSDTSSTNSVNVGGTMATIKLSAQGSIASGSIGGIELTLTLPSGVLLRGDDKGKPDDGIITVAGVATGSLMQAKYTPATSTTAGKIKIGLISAAGFGAGEFVTISAKILSGFSAKSSDFTISGVKILDGNGVSLTGGSVSVAIE